MEYNGTNKSYKYSRTYKEVDSLGPISDYGGTSGTLIVNLEEEEEEEVVLVVVVGNL